MDRNNNALVAFYMNANGVSATAAKNALKAISEEEFAILVAEYESAQLPKSTGKLVQPEQFSVVGKITEIVPLSGEFIGNSAVTIKTPIGQSITFVITNKQAGDEQTRGFNLVSGKVANFTLEKRLALKTQYVDTKDGLIKQHQKDGFGFVSCGTLDAEEYMISRLENTSPERVNAVANVMLRMEELRMKRATPAPIEE